VISKYVSRQDSHLSERDVHFSRLNTDYLQNIIGAAEIVTQIVVISLPVLRPLLGVVLDIRLSPPKVLSWKNNSNKDDSGFSSSKKAETQDDYTNMSRRPTDEVESREMGDPESKIGGSQEVTSGNGESKSL
jgi:hypothetical protein